MHIKSLENQYTLSCFEKKVIEQTKHSHTDFIRVIH